MSYQFRVNVLANVVGAFIALLLIYAYEQWVAGRRVEGLH